MVINRNSMGYRLGRLLAKGTLIMIGVLLGMKYLQKPSHKG
jgi:hypothetical protein